MLDEVSEEWTTLLRLLDAGADNKTIAKQMQRVQRAVARDLNAEDKRAKRVAGPDAPRDPG